MSGKAPYGYKLEPTVIQGIRSKMSEKGISVYGKALARGFVSQLLRNPAYAQADLELYEFFKTQGAAIANAEKS